jgi:large conductance mechanosensitive channel
VLIEVLFDRIAAAFTKVVSSLVSDIILPIVSLLPMLRRNLDEKFAVLRNGDSGGEYKTVAQALDDGAVVMAYGCIFPFFPPSPDLTWRG